MLMACARIEYLSHITHGQLSLEWKAKNNEEVLSDPNVNKKIKDKIRLVIKAKNYFMHYFKMDDDDIYSQTTFLEDKAVTYLVITSSKEKVQAKTYNFWPVGKFPYLGFFSKEKALEHVQYEESLGMDTYLRPVYAYSSLDKLPFSDNILSSFFEYDDQHLIKLIFHELYHVLYFMGDDVDLNENLAEFFSQKLYEKYIADHQVRKVSKVDMTEFYIHMSELIKVYKRSLELLGTKDISQIELMRQDFLNNFFIPSLSSKCKTMGLKTCPYLDIKWNHASFVAFETYHSMRNDIEREFKNCNCSLMDFHQKIVNHGVNF